MDNYLGEWLHVCGTYNGDETPDGFKLYLNNIRVDVYDYDIGSYSGLTDTSQPIYIGRRDTVYADGKMHDVKIFDVELSQAQVTEDYNTGKLTDLVAHYKLYYDTKDSGPNEFDGINTDVTFELETGLRIGPVNISKFFIDVIGIMYYFNTNISINSYLVNDIEITKHIQTEIGFIRCSKN